PPVNVWSHVALTYDGTAMRLFQDGVEVGSQAQTGAIVTTAGSLRIGGNTIWPEWFDGLIDEVRVYNRALSASEIATDMNTPITGGGPVPDTLPPVRSNGQPSGTLPAGTTSTSLRLTTDEVATCRYSLVAGTSYHA